MQLKQIFIYSVNARLDTEKAAAFSLMSLQCHEGQHYMEGVLCIFFSDIYRRNVHWTILKGVKLSEQ